MTMVYLLSNNSDGIRELYGELFIKWVEIVVIFVSYE